jgi:uncharacterized protein (DUF2164 family)
MPKIEFSSAEKAVIIPKVQLYFQEELDTRLGSFDAEFLLDFFAEQVGVYFYNRGLYDAQAILTARLDDIGEAILALEQPTDFVKDD